MTEYNHLITLKPVEDYYFGGEKTFGQQAEDEKDPDSPGRARMAGKRETSYFAYSNEYPQQTALLGVLRFILLAQNDALPLSVPSNRKKANALIGQRSFDPEKNGQSFGAIKSLSPMMLQGNGRFYRFGNAHESLPLSMKKEGQFVGAIGNVSQGLPVLSGFDPKEDYPRTVIALGGEEEAIPFTAIFKDRFQVGIEKKTGTDDRSEAFYEQQTYTLKGDFAFAFLAKVDTHTEGDEHVHLKDGTVTFGGEQKQFRLQVQPFDPKKENHRALADLLQPQSVPELADKLYRVHLLSDALVSKEVYDYCRFAIAGTEDFRTVTHNFNKRMAHESSHKYNLLQRGSMLYVEGSELKDVIKELNDPEDLRNIGFNHYIIREQA
ncbi:MAG: type III-B CRISPR module-associated Cmr3 family protein [Cyclobacteriaceae bacterium]